MLGKIQHITIDGHPLVIISRTGGKMDHKHAANSDHAEYVLSHVDCAHSVSSHEMLLDHMERDGATGLSVLELFGGSGWLTAQIQRRLAPSYHEVWDLSPWCVATINANTPKVAALVRDSYVDPIPEVDWIDCDYNNFTLGRLHKPGPERDLFTRVFTRARKYVTLADSALYGTKRWDKNLQSYAKKFNAELNDWRDYYTLIGDIVDAAYGFGLERVIIKKGWNCANLVFKKGVPSRGADGIVLCRGTANILIGELEDDVEVNLQPGREDPDWKLSYE
jgi:hypothetical protein